MLSRFAPAGRRTAFLASLASGALLLAATVLPQSAQPAQAAPLMRMPFRCGQTWNASTRSDHSPQFAVDFNRDNDFGDAVIASAGGRVTTVRNLGDTSYGRYIIIDHGGGWTTLYAHLSEFAVSQGQNVSMGQRIGSVGNSGGSSGPHLHYEQRLNGADQRVVLGGNPVTYFDSTQSLTSHNSC
ncbi:MAG: M23 family metallopeptidase [Chloroflexi bacterium]|nr:M23 family metallopeptidase [Chloroflexota bacterium]